MAVYTEIDDASLTALVAEYDIGTVVSCKGIAEGVENSNYMLATTKGAYIVTLYEKRTRSSDLPFFLALMDHLAARGIACPTPIHGRDGKSLRKACGRPAAIVSFLQGVWHRAPSAAHCAGLGKAMAEMHLASASFNQSRANDLSLDGWRRLAETCGDNADKVRQGLSQCIREELTALALVWPGVAGSGGTGSRVGAPVLLPRGIVHADLFPDNVLFLDDKLSGIIDFYFACEDFYAYELAIVLNAWCFEPDGEFNVTKARQLLRAYTRIRPLSGAELDFLPILARGAALRFLLTRLYDWLNQVPGAMVKPKNPLEYLGKLEFHRRVENVGAYGLDYA
jgi:homoserine kinase type II